METKVKSDLLLSVSKRSIKIVLKNMKSILFHLLLCSSIILTVYAKIDCHYCGIKKLCPLPYSKKEQDKTERVHCETSCLKFDGYSEG